MNDLKFALRQLRKNPGFTAVAVLTLALGIGANTAIFTLINALVLRSLHVPEPERLVRVTVWSAPVRDEGFPYGFYQRLEEHAPSHTTLAAAQRWVSKRELTATGLGQTEPEAVNALAVSGSFFPVLGVSAIVGRSRSEEHTSELQSRQYIVCRLLLEKKTYASPLFFDIEFIDQFWRFCTCSPEDVPGFYELSAAQKNSSISSLHDSIAESNMYCPFT